MKIDLHTHTNIGSSCAYMDPDQLINRAKDVGLDGVCITDHDHIWSRETINRLIIKHDFLVIGGCEVSTDCGEILTFGLHESVLNIYHANDLKEMVDEAGGAMVLAHPFRSDPALVNSHYYSESKINQEFTEEVDLVCSRPVFKIIDSMEIYNGQSGFRENKLTVAVANRLNFQGTGGSDAHAILGVGSCYTSFREEIKNEQQFVCQIKQGLFHGVDLRWKEY